MPFPADRIGLQLPPQSWDVSTRMILAYAAGLGADEPAYLDDVQAGGLRALPFQCVSLEWPVLLSLRTLTEAVLTRQEAMRGVHAVQDSTFHRPIRAGDRLVTEGQLVSAASVRAGTLVVLRLTTRNRDAAEIVTTTWTSSIYRDVALMGAPASVAAPDPIDPADLAAPSADAERVKIAIPKGMAHVYSECADIWNPIHTERAVALAAGLPDIILHGTATWALAGLTLLRRYSENNVGALKRITGRFSGMVLPGETIEIRHEKAPSGAIRFAVLTQSGQTAISQGAAWL